MLLGLRFSHGRFLVLHVQHRIQLIAIGDYLTPFLDVFVVEYGALLWSLFEKVQIFERQVLSRLLYQFGNRLL